MTNPQVLWQLATIFIKLSLIAIGGSNAALPAYRHEVVEVFHLMDDSTFTQLFAIAQLAPGPNVIVVTLIGWQVAGLMGAMVTTLSMLTPACLLAYFVGRFSKRFIGTENYKLAQNALIPLAVGLILAGGLDLAQASYRNIFTVAITVLSTSVIYFVRINPVWVLVGSASITLAASYLGLIVF